MESTVRFPAAAGSFYPSDPSRLQTAVDDLLKTTCTEHPGNIRALVVPHAGYRFSGATAAAAYSVLRNRPYKTVFIMGNTHAQCFEGIAIDGHHIWRSPLGDVPVNTALAVQLRDNYPELVSLSTTAHQSDHVLEVQLPFLQRSLSTGFSILPMLFGSNPGDIYQTSAKMLLTELGTDDLIIASTDLSHYPSMSDAVAIDRETMRYIVKKDIMGLEKHERETLQRHIPREVTLFCGPDGLKTVMLAADHLSLQATALHYTSSGDAPFADRESVVGYGAVAFHE